MELLIEYSRWKLIKHPAGFIIIVCPCGDKENEGLGAAQVCRAHWGKMPRKLYESYRLLVL